MREHLETMLENIKKDLIFLANEVEDSLYRALKSLEKQDKELAQKVTKADKKINLLEVEIEKQIMSLMALQQPVAVDLRFLVVALRMNNDLERIGDHAKNIAKCVKKISGEPFMKTIEKIPALGKICKNMLRDAVQSFINQNSDLALEVRERDKEVDSLNDEICEELLKEMETEKKYIRQGVELINIARQLERVADLAANLGEDVVFMKDATIVRYGIDKK